MGEPISYIARKYIEEDIDFVVARIVSTSGSTPRKRGAVMLMNQDGQTSGTVGGGLLEAETEKLCREMLKTGKKHMTYKFILDEKREEAGALAMGCGGDTTIDLEYISAADPGDFVEEFKVFDKVFIFGAGHVAKALEPVMRHIDFETYVIDDREDYANRDRFPDATKVIVCSDFEHCFDDIETDDDSYLIIVTRGHTGDEVVLRQALNKPHAYIGMIGSKRKIGILFDHMRETGISDEVLSEIYTPIGLPIGAETPEEIGVSIAAEIIKIRSERTPEDEKPDVSVLLHS